MEDIDALIQDLAAPQEGTVILLSGPSGVGKGTLVKELMPRLDRLRLSTSMTTRKARPGEIDGESYFFVDRSTFQEKIEQGEFLEYAEYQGNFYGTPRSYVQKELSSGRDVILEIETQGAEQVQKNWERRVASIFILPPSWHELTQRLSGRNTETEAVIAARLDRAQQELKQLVHYDYCVVNDSLEQAAKDIEHIIRAERLKR